MTWTGTGAPIADAEASSYSMTLTEIEAAIARLLAWDTNDTDDLARIDEAITAVGQAACTYRGRKWSWLEDKGSFSTVAGTGTYNLRSEFSALFAPRRVFCDNNPMEPLTNEQYDALVEQDESVTTGRPHSYAITGKATLCLYPAPDAEYTVAVSYVKRHPVITHALSADSDLLIPEEFQYPLYVQAAVWFLKQETTNPISVTYSRVFKDTVQEMWASRADAYTDLYDPGDYEDGLL